MSLKGFIGKLIRVNLSRNKINIERVPRHLQKRFLGGRGLASWYIYQEVNQTVKPLSQNNKIYFFTGPLTGTMFPGSARCCITTKSPLTEIYLCSIVGGPLGLELKRAGYDGLIIEGTSKEPVYIQIIDESITIEDARDYKGMTTTETLRSLQKDVDKKLKVACIGPAGENLVKYASIISHNRAAGRGGAGAVMGAKKLKAIAIYGSKSLTVANPDGLKSLCLEICKKSKQDPSLLGNAKYGTPSILPVINEVGILPTKNFIKSSWCATTHLFEELEKCTIKNTGCPYCPVACGKLRSVKRDGVEIVTEGPEYETLYSLGSCCLNSDLGSIIEADKMCDEYGLDTISTGVSIAFAMECYDRGILTDKETGGLKLEWGNGETILELIKKIAFREGIGNLLAEGTRKASKVIGKGSERFAMHVKGLELGGYDPRGAKGEGLSFATCERGGCHHSGGYAISAEIFGAVDRFTEKGKGKLVKDLRVKEIIFDSAMACVLYSPILTLDTLANAINLAVGSSMDKDTLMKIGERIITVERLFNVREGNSRKDDTLPARLLKEPVSEGPCKGHTVNLDPMLDEFYRTCGWSMDGKPIKQLKELL